MDIEKIIQFALERGTISIDELNRFLPAHENSSDQIERIIARLAEAGVEVIDAPAPPES